MKKLIGLSVFVMFTFTSLIQAQAIRNAAEAAENKEEIRIGNAELDRDVQELHSFKAKLHAFEIAFQNRDLDKARTLKIDIVSDMHREIQQSERKIAQDREEVGESTAERNASNREVRRSRRDVADNGTATNSEIRSLRDDRRDRADDQRDLNDDKSDLEQQIARTARQKFIVNALKAVNFSFDLTVREQVVANKKLIHEFVQTMEADIAATKIELKEDKVETAEDRRERREDRRTRRG